MNELEMQSLLKDRYGISFSQGYLHYALVFNELDKNCKELQIHHLCPRCCGGGNENDNLVRITFHHHRKLHH